MRYYRILITNPRKKPPDDKVLEFTSHPSGPLAPADPGALNIEINAMVAPLGIPAGATQGASVRLWGIPLALISQARKLGIRLEERVQDTGLRFQLWGGMGRGLPLANPQQIGLLLDGSIFQCFANWFGTAMTLEFNLVPGQFGSGRLDQPVNLTFTWRAGQPMGDAIRATLKTAYPDYQPSITVSSRLVANHDTVATYSTLADFSAALITFSKAVITDPNYLGVSAILTGTNIYVTDSTSTATPKTISFFDLLGQPTWVGYSQVQVMLVMRGDIAVGDVITLPKGQQAVGFTTGQAQAGQRQSSIFQGNFQVFQVRHIGNFRATDAQGWITVLDLNGPFSSKGAFVP